MNFDSLPEMALTILPPIPHEARWLFDIVMVIFIAAIIWHAKKTHEGW